MSTGSYLIHSGLPWSSPQKIAIGSAQYINNIVINRGLLNLLNNDYYLDLKTQALNNYIESNISTHISDSSIHTPWSRIKNLIGKYKIASGDAMYYIPVSFNGVKLSYEIIQHIIDQVPKNLNGHTIILLFCNAYNQDIYKDIKIETIDLGIYGLSFQSFNGGTVIIYSKSNSYKITSYNDISQLKVSSNDSSVIYKEITGIVYDNTDSSGRITFTGTGINKNYSVMSINNCQANIYLINLNVENTITWTKEAIDEEKKKAENALSKDIVMLLYPMKQGGLQQTYCQEEVLNTSLLTKNNSYDIRTSTPFENMKQEYVKDNKTYTRINLNSQSYLNQAANIPQYLYFDDENNNEASISEELRAYIYNWNGNNQPISFIWGGVLSSAENSNIPIYSDYFLNDVTNQQYGFYVYLNKIYNTVTNTENTTVDYYKSDFQNKSTQINLISGLYILQFLTSTPSDKNDRIVDSEVLYNTPIKSNYFRVHLSFYNGTDFINLIPRLDTLNEISKKTSSQQRGIYLRNIRFQMPIIPKQSISTKSTKLFANKINNDTESISSWDYYTGCVKNLFVLDGFLTRTLIRSMYNKIFTDDYIWISQDDKRAIQSLDVSSSYVGSVYLSNNQNINIFNCNLISK